MTTLASEALVLRRIPFSDSSLVVHLFTPGSGRVAALAKGAFRFRSPHFAGLDLLDRIDADWVVRRGESMAILSSSRLLDAHRGLRRSSAALRSALYAAELVDRALPAAPLPGLYARFVAWLESIDAGAVERPAMATVLLFELGFLLDIGLRPELDRCVECERPLAREISVAMSASAGGALCGRCAPRGGDAVILSAAAVALARDLLARAAGAGPEPMAMAMAASSTTRELRRWLDRFHAYHLDGPLRSRRSLELLDPPPAT